jgi:DNA-binding response OmpR family regulator
MTDQPGEPRTYEHRALLLDDDDANRMLLSIAFDMAQLPFCEAHNGEQALRLCAANRFAFAFLDIDLPDISGLEVAQRIRAQDQGIALIMCSANDDPLTVAQAVAVDCDLFFVKPFQLDVLLNTIKRLDRAALRANPRILIVDNTQRPRWEDRLSSAPSA